MNIALTIAGSDSGGGAGIQADIKTFAAHGVYGISAITAVTAQNTIDVTAVHAVPAEVVVSQIESAIDDFGVDAAKTGMLLNVAIVEAISACIKKSRVPYLVVDPVMIAKSGDKLLCDDAVTTMKNRLLPLAYVVTPNRIEAEVLTGQPIASTNEARDAARRIHDLGPTAVVLKGGHIPGKEIVDLLFDGHDFIEFCGPRIKSTSTHGTGCTFGAAITASLACGRPLTESIQTAKLYVEQAIRLAPAVGRGQGPLNHFWRK